jgi:hypothetical protein
MARQGFTELTFEVRNLADFWEKTLPGRKNRQSKGSERGRSHAWQVQGTPRAQSGENGRNKK